MAHHLGECVIGEAVSQIHYQIKHEDNNIQLLILKVENMYTSDILGSVRRLDKAHLVMTGYTDCN